MSSAADLIRRFYETRQHGDPQLLRPFLSPDVRWMEPTVGTHMGTLVGVEAVLDMLSRALATTGGTFSLQITQTIETANTCAAVIAWAATKDDRPVRGRELAVFEVTDDLITTATFHAERLSDDEAFWA
ncbi:nuclear transport factor 2 family protein [Kineococcus arenarius]|uniref:nuclear transport factor 2 family protein n=1 Tax=unclassified Kineococcus TaxID=2621656 RepID=UPI003D7C7665